MAKQSMQPKNECASTNYVAWHAPALQSLELNLTSVIPMLEEAASAASLQD
jgi:hypothetical protein